MSITNLEHKCPVCNALFRVSYDKSKAVKGLDKAIEYLSMIATAEDGLGGYTGRTIAKEVIKGRDSLFRKITGKAEYRFKCPRCGYESKILIL